VSWEGADPPRDEDYSGAVERGFGDHRLRKLYDARQGLPTFWRHDVDVSLEAALEMAWFEAQRNVTATYFIMPVDNPFYTETEALGFAGQIADLGHSVALHVDPRYHEDMGYLLRAVGHAGQFSWHCPRVEDLWVAIPKVKSAYDPYWEGAYYSDSRGRFAYGDPEDDRQERPVQIALHPEWWFSPEVHDDIPDDVYEDFFHEPKALLARP
jgi:hypothetical protein